MSSVLGSACLPQKPTIGPSQDQPTGKKGGKKKNPGGCSLLPNVIYWNVLNLEFPTCLLCLMSKGSPLMVYSLLFWLSCSLFLWNCWEIQAKIKTLTPPAKSKQMCALGLVLVSVCGRAAQWNLRKKKKERASLALRHNWNAKLLYSVWLIELLRFIFTI